MELTTNKKEPGLYQKLSSLKFSSIKNQLSEQLYQKSQDIIPTDFYKFCSLLRIRSGSKITPLIPYDYQLELSDNIDAHKHTLVVKTRQLGITQIVIAKFLQAAILNPAFTGLFISINQAYTSKSADRCKEMIDSLGDLIALETDNKQHIKVKGGGQIYFKNSKADTARGLDSVTMLFYDETAFIENFERLHAATTPCLEYAGDNARFIYVTTPNGNDEWFYHKLTSDNNEDILNRIDQVKRGDDVERSLIDKNGFCKMILHYRHHPVFGADPEYLERRQRDLQISRSKIEQEFNLGFADSQASIFPRELVDKANRDFEIKSNNVQYYIGIDPAGSGDDYTVVMVGAYDGKHLKIVDMYRDNLKSSNYNISKTNEIISKYRPVRCGVETNGGYGDKFMTEVTGRIEGIQTNEKSKQAMIDKILLFLERELLIINQDILLQELKVFKRNGKKLTAPNGLHDDCVMGLAMLLKVVPDISKAFWAFA